MDKSSSGSLSSSFVAFLIVLGVYTVFAGGTPHGRSPNEQSRLELSVALAKYGSISLDPVLKTYGTPFDRAEREGRIYSDKAPGLSLFGVPIVWFADLFLPREGTSYDTAYWSLRHLMTWLLITLPAASFPFVALRCFKVGTHLRQNIRIALLFALVTPVMTYSAVLFGHVPSGTLAAFAWILTLNPSKEDRFTFPSVREASMSGLCIALATTIEYPTALVGLVIVSTMILRKVPIQTIAAFVRACVIGLIPCLIYHQMAFGSPFTTGYAFKGNDWHAVVHSAGLFGVTIPRFEHLWGILAGTKRGVLFYCPLLLLVPLGFVQMERTKRYSSYPFLALGIIYLLFASGFSDWQAGWSAAARHLVPCIMIFIFPLAHAVYFITSGQNKNRSLVWLLLCCVALSITGSFLSLSLSPFFPEHFSSPLGQLVLPAMADGYFAPTLLSGTNLSYRVFIIGLLAFTIFTSVSWAMIGLLPTIKLKFVIPITLIFVAFLYAGLIWNLAQPLAEDQRQMRLDVLYGLGYGSKMQNIQEGSK